MNKEYRGKDLYDHLNDAVSWDEDDDEHVIDLDHLHEDDLEHMINTNEAVMKPYIEEMVDAAWNRYDKGNVGAITKR